MKESACANDVSKFTHALRCLKLLIAISKLLLESLAHIHSLMHQSSLGMTLSNLTSHCLSIFPTQNTSDMLCPTSKASLSPCSMPMLFPV